MNRKNITVLVAIFLIILGGLIAWHFITYKKPNITLTVAPSVAIIKVDDKKQIKQGKLFLEPGKHQITITMSGFATQNITLTAPSTGENSKTVILIPSSQEGYDWLTNHPKEAARREGLAGTAFTAQNVERSKKLPLIADLPHIDNFYRVDYGVSKKNPKDSTAVAIYVTYYSDDGKQQAIDWLKFKGYTANTSEIIFQPKGYNGNE